VHTYIYIYVYLNMNIILNMKIKEYIYIYIQLFFLYMFMTVFISGLNANFIYKSTTPRFCKHNVKLLQGCTGGENGVYKTGV